MVNVSEGFQLRTAYKKKVKPSKLDGLLERRVKQFTLEEKQRLERMRQALSKAAAMKPTTGVKTEGAALNKLQPAASSAVKAEEKEENLQVKDHVVKKLEFEQEDTKTEIKNIKPDPGNEEACTNKEVNGEPELSSTTSCQSEKTEHDEKTQKEEGCLKTDTPKKRGYDEMEQSSGKSDAENMKETQSKSRSSQVNGKATTADTNSNSDPGNPVQSVCSDPETEPVKSLMNGNLSQKDFSNAAHPPPLKVPKLENHVSDKEEPVNKSDATTDSEGSVAAKLESSSTSCHNSNNTDICTNVSSKESQSSLVRDTANSINKPDATSRGEMSSVSSGTGPVTTQPSLEAAGFQKKKPNDTKPTPQGSASTSSMTISKEYSTKDRVSLLRYSKSKKARSGIALPSYRKFVTKSSKKSLFVLPNDELKRLARKAGIKEVPIFSYNAKPAPDIWPYPSPRPTFGIAWRSVTNLVPR